MTQSFRLAPMSPFIRWLTWILLALPAAFVAAALTSTKSFGLIWAALLLAGLYAAVWVWWRPSRFEVSPQGLVVVFPGRRRVLAASDIASAAPLSRLGFHQQFGRAMRVGVGGLWGGFGWLWTRNGWVEFYVSTLDRYVLIRRHRRIPLLISPQDPEQMVVALEQHIPGLNAAAP